MPDPRIEALERAAARHWQAPDTEPLGEWLLRAADGFTGRANSALPLGDPGRPLPAAVTAVAEWYRRRGLRPMIVLPQGAAPDHLENHLNERGWVPRPGSAFTMTADLALPSHSPPGARSSRLPALLSHSPPGARSRRLPSSLVASSSLVSPDADAPFGSRGDSDVEFAAEPDEAFLGLYRYRGQDLPPMARTLLMSAPWQAFGSIRRDGRAVAVGRVSVADDLGVLTAVEVDPAYHRQGLGTAITAGLAAAAAARDAKRILLQVETTNDPARALYFRCGFQDSHRYQYMMAP
jgi:ribosomal protein S18 acetylase RimI-like enzyme